ncbi:MAG: rhodanese-like domain-containing protein [Phycisphaerae bacterium]
MHGVKNTVLEALALGILAAVIGFTANGVRASGSVKFTRNYFPKADTAPQPTQRANKVVTSEATQSDDSIKTSCEHPFEHISFDDVVAIFNDPNTAMGVNVFIDARSEKVYAEGHIPGAIQADHYNLEECIDHTLDHVQCADKVIVYCAGGKCEDSLFLCTNLSEFEVPDDKLFLYHGGWEEWKAKGMPVAKGPGEGG